jgi:hypothetical protein
MLNPTNQIWCSINWGNEHFHFYFVFSDNHWASRQTDYSTINEKHYDYTFYFLIILFLTLKQNIP